MSMDRKKIFEIYMNFVGPIGNMASFFQAYEIFKSKSSGSVSLSASLISFITLVSWFLYGMYIKNKPLILGNIVGIIGVSLVLISLIYYRHN